MYREIAEKGEQFRGYSILQHRVEIGDLVQRTGARTLLDYGAGAGDAYQAPHLLHESWGVDRPTLFDPAFIGHDALPPVGIKFDGVLCSDVLEHVPVEQCLQVVNDLFGYSRGFVWASVCCRPAKKAFANGVNMHATVRPLQWWCHLFETVAPHGAYWQLAETP